MHEPSGSFDATYLSTLYTCLLCSTADHACLWASLSSIKVVEDEEVQARQQFRLPNLEVVPPPFFKAE